MTSYKIFRNIPEGDFNKNSTHGLDILQGQQPIGAFEPMQHVWYALTSNLVQVRLGKLSLHL